MFDLKAENLSVPGDAESARDLKCKYTFEEHVFLKLNNVSKEFNFVHAKYLEAVVMSYLPGTANLVEEVDKRLLVVLRDGRTLIGYLRSVDQFANLLLQDTIERIYVEKKYGDIPRGIFLVRGENVSLLGEIDNEKEEKLALTKVSIEEILEAQQLEEQKQKKSKEAKFGPLLGKNFDDSVDDY